MVIFSKTLGGAAETNFGTGDTIFGRILNLSQTNAQSCSEIVGTNDGRCTLNANWSPLPNGDWTWDAASSQWRATFAAGTFPAGSYRVFARDSNVGVVNLTVTITIGASTTAPIQEFSSTPDGAPETSFRTTQTFYGRIRRLTATNGQGCVEIVGSTDGNCNNLANWTALNSPNSGWTYDAAASLWRTTYPANAYPAGQYKAFARNSMTGEQATPVVITLTAPNCYWSAFVPGPVNPPTQSCTMGNVGAMADASGYTWTCTCN